MKSNTAGQLSTALGPSLRKALDHLAIIDLPSPGAGIAGLKSLFETIGFSVGGHGYLPDKKNDFIWMAETDAHLHPATDVLPQIVIGDFRLPECSPETAQIVRDHPAAPVPLDSIRNLAAAVRSSDARAAQTLTDTIFQYLTDRPLSTLSPKTLDTVRRENELLAWTLEQGRDISHFGIAAHEFDFGGSLTEFMSRLHTEFGISHHAGGAVRGDRDGGIEQSSTPEENGRFVEFVWRHPVGDGIAAPQAWKDRFRGFIPRNANRIIETLYRS